MSVFCGASARRNSQLPLEVRDLSVLMRFAETAIRLELACVSNLSTSANFALILPEEVSRRIESHSPFCVRSMWPEETSIVIRLASHATVMSPEDESMLRSSRRYLIA